MSESEVVWLRAFQRTLRQNRLHADSYRRLSEAGLPESLLISLLFSYCDEAGRQAMRDVQLFSQHLRKVIEETLPSLHVLHAQLSLEDEGLSVLPYGWPLEQRSAADAEMSDLIVELSALLWQLEPFSVKRGKGRDEGTLVRLCLIVAAVTGEPRWEDIANLLEAGEAASGSSGAWTADMVRKSYGRYEVRHPAEFKDFKTRADAEAAGLRSQPMQSRSSRNRRNPPKGKQEVPPAYFRP